MRSFFKYFLASFAAVLIAGIFLLFIASWSISNLLNSLTAEKTPTVEEGSLLVLKLQGTVEERVSEDPLTAMIEGNGESKIALNTTLQALKAAKKDDRIRGLYLHCDMLNVGIGHAEALRNAILDFKQSGKFVWAYGDSYMERVWYIASAADSIFMQPTGYMEWNGLVSTPLFIKGSLEKLYITPRVFRVGEFKSAGEMFDRTDLSTENRRQVQAYIDDIWEHMLAQIHKSRKLDTRQLNELAATLAITHAREAHKHHMVDALLHKDQLRDLLKKKVKTSEDGEIVQITTDSYAQTLKSTGKKDPEAKIAIVYANGGIMTGKGDISTVGSDGMARTLRKLREDKTVKAVVFRVNSPGGSALASDIIAREMQLLCQEKPVAVSMGDVAASGGYYISAHAHRIFAEPTTLTGSIGVIGLWLNTQQFFNRHLGVTFGEVTGTHTPYANMLNPTRPLSELEAQTLQRQIETVYKEFVEVVQQGRKFPSFEAVDSLARGHVYSGITALHLKLVDELGGVPQALSYVAKKAGLGEDAYTLAEYPHLESPFQKLLASFLGEAETWVPVYRMLGTVFSRDDKVFLLNLLQAHRQSAVGIYMHTGNFFNIH
ncbi:MAG: signal peptide peptidase SppA [Bacteroidetes bacterium]|nr:signal peptide peptidase SppA [Bacteroidota bacterium]